MKKLKPENIEISVKYFKGINYTPEDAMKKWAKENYEVFYRGIYGKLYIRLYGASYYYDSWKISQNPFNDSMEIVTIKLKRVEE